MKVERRLFRMKEGAGNRRSWGKRCVWPTDDETSKRGEEKTATQMLIVQI